MTQLDKLKAKILAKPPQADFGDVRLLLEAYGWTMRQRGRNPHPVFEKQGEYPIVVPTVSGRKVKRVYLAEICGRLGLEED